MHEGKQMCDFCSHIVEDSEVGWDDSTLITYDRKFNMFSIEIGTGDPYDGAILQDVNFCPYCGEKLIWKGETDG